MKHIFQQGNKFQIGCNYWASHAGPDMWRDWDAEQVDRDFAVLATYELDCVRVFPTWRDFQPFIRHCGCMNDTVELRRGEMPRTGDFEEYSGVDPVMLERFHVLSQLALKHNLKLIVSLVTGWMSGRMFVPQAFEQSRLLTDPAVIHEEVRYVRTLVRSLKNEPAIIAWEPGNESNCMERVSDIQMWHWFDTICNAIRREDGSRPLLIAVTQLTSTDQESMERDILIKDPIDQVVMHYAKTAKNAGLDGIVCSPLEAGQVHDTCGKEFLTITPGVRFADGEVGDQKRVMTPAQAKLIGSDYIVVGRPITATEDPVAAYERCVAEFCD